MMMNSTKNLYKFSPGTVIIGKWNKNKYKIIRELGEGATGTVYLVESHNRYAALKMSRDSMAITSEVNVLKVFTKVQDSLLGPSLIEMDDWEINKESLPFYVMEYVKGKELLAFMSTKDFSWSGVLILQLLNDLHQMHEAGWIFGDLKPENLIVTDPPYKIRCIDVGGTTMRGRALKEYTKFFDRGYWGLGTRKAEPSYDLFAVAMIMINICYPKRFPKKEGGLVQLRKIIQQTIKLKPFENILIHALTGKYATASEMRIDLLQLLTKLDKHPSPMIQQGHPKSRVLLKKKKKESHFFETIVITTIISFIYVIYIVGQLL